MAAQPPRQLGVTAPLSTAPPTEKEAAVNDLLIEELKAQKNFEDPKETEKRKTVLQSIQKITEEFVRRASRANKKPESIVASSGGKIFTYGSYRLGVFGPGSDIDTLVVVPSHVTRENFFEIYPKLLEEMAPPGAIEDLTPVPDAFVPIIKFEYSGISIDLIYARLAVSQVPQDLDLKNNDLLRGVEERDLRSLNGTRVTDEILELVPQVKVFKIALRAVKLWAQRKAVYANVYGFPGGVAWAMLVARICQLYPRATSSVILAKFFKILTRWSWPQPVMLKTIESGPLNARVWNPVIYPSDRFHLMPIITPAYPSMCATHNITQSTKQIILDEMQKAGDVVNTIFAGKLQWKDLFTRHTFFTNGFKYYLTVISASKSKEAQLIWSGLVESKVRTLVTGLENSEFIRLAHPYVKGFDRTHVCHNDEEIERVKNGDMNYLVKESEPVVTSTADDATRNAVASENNQDIKVGDSSPETKVSNGVIEHTVYTTAYYIGLELNTDISKSLDVSYETGDFKARCISWDQFDEDLMSINVVHTRNYDLPLDVFEPGEQRPVRQKNKKNKGSSIKKRTLVEANLEESSDAAHKKVHASNGVTT